MRSDHSPFLRASSLWTLSIRTVAVLSSVLVIYSQDLALIANDAVSIDYIIVHKYASTEPTPSLGVEQTFAFTIESCDSSGVRKDRFNQGETVYVTGSGYPPSQTYDIYVVDNTTWTNGMTIPDRVSRTVTSVLSNSSGYFPPTQIWDPQLTLGKYDIVVDVNSNGRYDAGVDALDDLDIHGAGFFVIPEYAVGTILALAVCFGGVFVYRRYKNNKLKPF